MARASSPLCSAAFFLCLGSADSASSSSSRRPAAFCSAASALATPGSRASRCDIVYAAERSPILRWLPTACRAATTKARARARVLSAWSSQEACKERESGLRAREELRCASRARGGEAHHDLGEPRRLQLGDEGVDRLVGRGTRQHTRACHTRASPRVRGGPRRAADGVCASGVRDQRGGAPRGTRARHAAVMKDDLPVPGGPCTTATAPPSPASASCCPAFSRARCPCCSASLASSGRHAPRPARPARRGVRRRPRRGSFYCWCGSSSRPQRRTIVPRLLLQQGGEHARLEQMHRAQGVGALHRLRGQHAAAGGQSELEGRWRSRGGGGGARRTERAETTS